MSSCVELGQELQPQVFLTGLRDLVHLEKGGGDGMVGCLRGEDGGV